MPSLYDEQTGAKVIGCLINEPLYSIDSKYSLTVDDFENFFHKVLFVSIHNLVSSGITVITPLEIGDYLSTKPQKYLDCLRDNDFVSFIECISQLTRKENIEYYVDILKKRSLLRTLFEAGYPIDSVFDVNGELEVENRKLENETLETIAQKVKGGMESIIANFKMSQDIEETTAGVSFIETKNRFKEEPLYGLPFSSDYLNTIIRGLIPGQITAISAKSGVGKTSFMASVCASVSAEKLYRNGRWVENPKKMSNGVLYIQFEMENETELEPKIASFITGIGANKIMDGDFNDLEDTILEECAEVMKESNIHLVCMPDFTAEKIRAFIQKYVYTYGVDLIIFDYIQESGGLNAEMLHENGGITLRTDQVLMNLTTELKKIARTFNVPVLTATQVNRNADTAPILDSSCIAGSSSVANKLDNGFFLTRITQKEWEATQAYAQQKGFAEQPTHVFHIHKARFSSFRANLKVFINWNMSTGQMQDMYVTDCYNNPFPIKEIKIIERIDNE